MEEERVFKFKPFDLRRETQGLRCDDEKMLKGHAKRELGLSIGFISMCSTGELIRLFVGRGWQFVNR